MSALAMPLPFGPRAARRPNRALREALSRLTGLTRRERRTGRILVLRPGRYTEDEIIEAVEGALRGIGLTMAGFSNGSEAKILDHITGKTTYTVTAPTYIALVTVAVGETDTAGTLTEASYTGYARKSLAAADMSAASAGETHNTAVQTFAACTAGSSTVIGWALCSSSSGAGDVIMFGTCPSTVVSTTQTPATVAASALSLTLD